MKARVMRLTVQLAVGMVAAAALSSGLPAWAQDQGQDSGTFAPGQDARPAEQGQQTYEATPAYGAQPETSGNIIGYTPLPDSAYDAAIAAGQQAQAGATPVYGTQGQFPTATPYNQLPDPKQRTVPQNLPEIYTTGIVGEGPYTLGRDDIINISVRNQPEFSGNFSINYEGNIQYSYFGDIPVGGMTKYEVQQVIEHMLKQYVRVPAVTVQIVGYNSKVVYVVGEVNRPGKYIMRGDVIKLRETILAAGLPNRRAALSRIHLIRPDVDDPSVRVVNMKRILYKGKLEHDVDVYPGEIVVVPSTVLSKINDFLGSLLSPASRAATAGSMASGL